ncbi:uncharacterized protein [Palaemon carinicauda]|uniref:uncharacterized protein isoform X2 n=1 Tax=Palaemon carinicauda TaxID=392227 RepID=UPI0035B6A777
MAVKLVAFLMILGYVVGMPDQAKSTHESLEPNDKDSETWESVGELVYDYNVTSTDGTEEVLNDANDPMVLSEDLCHSLIAISADMPEQLGSVVANLKLDQPSLGFARCIRTSVGLLYLCRGPRFVNFRGFRYCCGNPAMRPYLTRNLNYIRCRCSF